MQKENFFEARHFNIFQNKIYKALEYIPEKNIRENGSEQKQEPKM
jgi:hypothetical protein